MRITDVKTAIHTTLLPGPLDGLLPSCLLLEPDCGNDGGAMPLSEFCLDCVEGVVTVCCVDGSGAVERDETCDVVVVVVA